MSEPMILDCTSNEHAVEAPLHDTVSCWREATVAERLAGLGPEDGNLEAVRQRLVEWAYEIEGVTSSGEVVVQMLEAWLGENRG